MNIKNYKITVNVRVLRSLAEVSLVVGLFIGVCFFFGLITAYLLGVPVDTSTAFHDVDGLIPYPFGWLDVFTFGLMIIFSIFILTVGSYLILGAIFTIEKQQTEAQ